jgi:hypothetical protein
MNNSIKLALLGCSLSIAGTTYYSPTPTLPEATVEAITVEAVYEYAPPVTITIPHDEVVINGLRAG